MRGKPVLPLLLLVALAFSVLAAGPVEVPADRATAGLPAAAALLAVGVVALVVAARRKG